MGQQDLEVLVCAWKLLSGGRHRDTSTYVHMRTRAHTHTHTYTHTQTHTQKGMLRLR